MVVRDLIHKGLALMSAVQLVVVGEVGCAVAASVRLVVLA